STPTNALNGSADEAFTSSKVAVVTGALIEPLLRARYHINWINSRPII
ncbi:Os12g0550800, partial [Oryza sativa Japonica Group]